MFAGAINVYFKLYLIDEVMWRNGRDSNPCVTGRYSNQLNYRSESDMLIGGMDGTRTRDPLRDRQVF